MIYYYRINIETQKGQIKGCQIPKYLKANTNEYAKFAKIIKYKNIIKWTIKWYITTIKLST